MKLATFSVAMLIASSTAAVAQIPIINSVVSQASSTAPVSPGMPVLVNGTNLAGSPTNCAGPKAPLTCGAVSVTVNNRAVPVRSVFANQVVTYIPVDQPAGPASVVLKNQLGLVSGAFIVTVDAYAPGIQKMGDPSGSTLGVFSDASQRVINRINPASPGQELTVYAVGLGPTTPLVPTGEIGSAPVQMLPTVWIGNRSMPALTAGLGCGVICDPGNYMVRFFLPPDTPSSDQAVSLEIAGRRSSPATLVVGPPTSGPAVGYLQSVLDSRVRTLSPGSIAQVVGGGFAVPPGAAGPCSMDPSVWPTKCQGVTVTISG